MKCIVVPEACPGEFKYNEFDREAQMANGESGYSRQMKLMMNHQVPRDIHLGVPFQNETGICDLIVVKVRRDAIRIQSEGQNRFVASTPHEMPPDIEISEEESGGYSWNKPFS
jgi:hypothetical protein